ncbi:Hypothetical predicted protein [Mytilus galloprovincialis]|uniref:Gamma-aminobutyric acid receptor subunit beta n=1 Tax=Mytilus galloprovincialis TaxID=29158 RepID=A0A8B6ECH2_MYTGA|nr:Hypothetical predicted protein [Mytilus galloprovincialis]
MCIAVDVKTTNRNKRHKMRLTLLLPILSLLTINDVFCQTRTDFIRALLVDYDNRITPNFEKNIPTEVEVSLFINSIDSISEETMDFTMNTFVQQEWKDPRLDFHGFIDVEYLELDAGLIKEIWVPDLYFTNEKVASFHDVTVPNKMLHLFSDGRIVYRLRISLKASCPMDLYKYPMDEQTCSLYLQSFAFTTNGIVFKWKNDSAVQKSNRFELPQFRLVGNDTLECNESYGTNGNASFSCIQLDLHFKRNIGYYMIQFFVPSVMIVLLSWVSFWLTIDAVPARISLGILTVLTMTTQRSAGTASLPRVSYIKAIDVWMGACLVFVFAALLEFAFVNVMERRQIRRVQSVRLKGNGESKPCLEKLERNVSRQPMTGHKKAKTIDNVSRVIFPISFILFCVVYWVYYVM